MCFLSFFTVVLIRNKQNKTGTDLPDVLGENSQKDIIFALVHFGAVYPVFYYTYKISEQHVWLQI